jgi:hypothetical protein
MPASQTSSGVSPGRTAPKDLQRLLHALKTPAQSLRTFRRMRAILAAEKPAPVQHLFQVDPDRPAERSRAMRDRRIARDNQIRVLAPVFVAGNAPPDDNAPSLRL